ncbi:hypothetical protein SAZ11_16470 [Streptomyces sp. FXJ1.4098]|nr:hypothetical protein [Streptomyces sp. FXJ1.4098]
MPRPCLGYSFQSGQSVWEMVLERLPVSVTVAVGAAVLWLLGGVTIGLLSGVKEGTWWDRSTMALALGGSSIPRTYSPWRSSTCWWSSGKCCRSPRRSRSATIRWPGSSRI